jgi:tetratricopeptide (TPR) repeat protein
MKKELFLLASLLIFICNFSFSQKLNKIEFREIDKARISDFFDVRANYKSEIGDDSGAIDDYSNAINFGSKRLIDNFLIFRGEKKFSIGDYFGALDDYRRISIFFPYKNMLFNLKAFAKGGLSDNAGAIEDFTKAIYYTSSRDVENLGALYDNRGTAKLKNKDYSGAISDFLTAIKLDLKEPEYVYNIGLVKLAQNKKNEACIYFSRAGEAGFQKAFEAIKEYCN